MKNRTLAAKAAPRSTFTARLKPCPSYKAFFRSLFSPGENPISPSINHCAISSHRSHVLYQGPTLVGPKTARLMRALATEVLLSRSAVGPEFFLKLFSRAINDREHVGLSPQVRLSCPVLSSPQPVYGQLVALPPRERRRPDSGDAAVVCGLHAATGCLSHLRCLALPFLVPLVDGHTLE